MLSEDDRHTGAASQAASILELQCEEARCGDDASEHVEVARAEEELGGALDEGDDRVPEARKRVINGVFGSVVEEHAPAARVAVSRELDGAEWSECPIAPPALHYRSTRVAFSDRLEAVALDQSHVMAEEGRARRARKHLLSKGLPGGALHERGEAEGDPSIRGAPEALDLDGETGRERGRETATVEAPELGEIPTHDPAG